MKRVFQAQLEEIRQAAKNFYQNKRWFPAKYIKILMDSQAALKALNGQNIRSEMVRRTIQELSTLGFEIPRLTLAWIKAHVGHEWNEMADLTAKQGALEPSMRIKIDIPLLQTEISNKIKTLIYNKWHLRWYASTDYKHSKNFLSKPNPTKAKKILELPRLKMKRFVKIVLGLKNLGYFQYKVDPDEKTLCRFCEESNKTFHHFITNCPS